MVTMYFLVSYFQSKNNIGIIVSITATVMAVTALFYNLGELRNAKVPSSTLKRAKRR
jgi:VIT1/CCC1 family predicted Fe2+/Mn2+ transporter